MNKYQIYLIETQEEVKRAFIVFFSSVGIALDYIHFGYCNNSKCYAMAPFQHGITLIVHCQELKERITSSTMTSRSLDYVVQLELPEIINYPPSPIICNA